MKVETCITISAELLEQIDEFGNRSDIVETALREHIQKLKLRKQRAENAEKEREILNRLAIENRDEILETHRIVAELWLEDLNETR